MKRKTRNSSNADRCRNDFQRHAAQASPGLVPEFIDFVLHNKKWWLIPIIVALLLLGLLVVAGGSGLAPLIYTIF
jgi:hypothetical protein